MHEENSKQELKVAKTFLKVTFWMNNMEAHAEQCCSKGSSHRLQPITLTDANARNIYYLSPGEDPVYVSVQDYTAVILLWNPNCILFGGTEQGDDLSAADLLGELKEEQRVWRLLQN